MLKRTLSLWQVSLSGVGVTLGARVYALVGPAAGEAGNALWPALNLFRHKVFKMLVKEKKISRELVDKLLSWKNSGFNIHNQVKIQSRDSHGRESLAQYILRSPFSQQKMTYQQDSQTVLYRSKMNANLKRNFALFPVLDWIATLTAHIPNKGEQLVRYYGYYSNVSRGKRKKGNPEEKTETSWIPEVIEVAPPPISMVPGDWGEKLKEMKNKEVWDKGRYIEKQSWAIMPGDEKPESGVADACAKQLTEKAT